MNHQNFIQYMPEVGEYKSALNSLSERWNLLTLLGQMSNIGMDMSQTQDGFQTLTDRLLERLSDETLVKLTSEMEAKAQVAVDVLIRNLFERTADIGFLATDDDLRSFIQKVSAPENQEDGSESKITLQQQIVERFREYVAKYSVYSNIVLLDTQGKVLAQLDSTNDIQQSHDPLIEQALTTNQEYVEIYRHTDIQPSQKQSLIYAFRVTETNKNDSEVLGVLCLVFRFENEMNGIFKNLIGESDWMEITLLDKDGNVISSSDPYHIPIGANFPKILDEDYKVVRFAGREYLAKTCQTQGYEGFHGLGWYGHVMVPLDLAFRKIINGESRESFGNTHILNQVVSASTLFSNDLIDIPEQADRIQRELDVTVWNGNVKIANTKTGDNSFSKSLLNEISRTGAKTKQVFENSISNLNQTVISAFLEDAEFYALLAVDIMDRNLYERANDCRWWALTSRFKDILALGELNDSHRQEITNILKYINNLYTVYTNLFIYDRSGCIQAVSSLEQQHLVGNKISENWISETLNIKNSQDYSVSPFQNTPFYGGKSTYIYGASITHAHTRAVVGGIGIVFDAEPQFKQMLLDSLPKNDKGEIIDGCFGVFAGKNKNVISSTSELYPVDSVLPLTDKFFQLKNGRGLSDIIEMNGRYYVVGARMSAGYREYKVNDKYSNDIVSLVFVEIGEKMDQAESFKERRTVHSDNYVYPRVQGTEETVEISTFIVNRRLYGIDSKDVLCALTGQQITNILGSDDRFLGVISYMKKTIPVICLRTSLGGSNKYNVEKDSIIIARVMDEETGAEELLGLVIDQVKDSPEIPVRSLQRCDFVLRRGDSLIQYVVQPENNNENSVMLSIINMASVRKSVLSGDDIKKLKS